MENDQVKLVLHLYKMRYLFYIAISVLIVVFFAILSSPASALTTVPTKMNFQGRLADSAGNIKANGTYNMRLKLYTVSTGGANVWSEDRLVSATQGVTVTNGTFSIQLGSITTLPASLFASGDLYLEVELPTPATATSASPTWTEGPMTPRNQMATSAYAYNAETLDGIDSASFAQLGSSNTFSNANSIQATSTSALTVQSAAGANSFLTVDTSAGQITVGNAAADGIAVLLRLDDKNTTGDPTGVAGAIYYNSFDGKFRCYQGAAWTDCIGVGGSSTLQGAYTASTGGATPEIKLDATRGGFDIQDANTTIAGSLFTVRGANGVGLGAALLDITSTGVATFKNSANSTAAFAIQNAAGADLIKVDTTNNNITIGGVNGGEPQPWQTGTPLTSGAQARDDTGAVSYNGYIYIPAGGNGTAIQTSVASIKVKADGSLDSTWTTTGTSVPSRMYTSVTQANGYIYILGGTSVFANTDVRAEVYFAKINTDGTVGTFTATSSLPAARKTGGAVVMNGYMYYVGGDSSNTSTETPVSTVYYAKIKPDGTLDTWSTATNGLVTPMLGKGAVAANGFLYYSGNNGTAIKYVKPSDSTGNITSAWSTASNSLPVVRVAAGYYVLNGYLYAVGGHPGTGSGTNSVYYAPLGSSGDIGTWVAASAPNTLPAARQTVNFTQLNGRMYAIGGYTDTTAAATAYYSSTPRVSIGGSLDLVGLGGEFLTDGRTGGELTAGNTKVIGTLDVADSALFMDTVSIQRSFAVGNGIFGVDTENSSVQIGSSIADANAVLTVLDTKNTAGDPTGVVGAMYYNSNLGKFRCYQGAAWTDCIGAGGSSTLQDAYNNSTSPALITTTAAKTVKIAAGAVPTADLFSVDNTGFATVTDNANGIDVNYVGGAAAVEGAGMRVDYTPGGTTGGIWSGLRVVANATGAASGVLANGLKLQGPTTPGAGTDTALSVGTGWDIGVDIQSGGIRLAAENDPAAPAAGNLRIYAKDIAGRVMPKWIGPSGIDTPFQASLGFNRVSMMTPAGGTTGTTFINGFGSTFTNAATTYGNPAPATTNLLTSTRRATFTSAATAAAVVSHRQSVQQVTRGNAAGIGGFFYTVRFATSTLVAGNRAFVGLSDSVAAPTNVDPTTSATIGKIGVAINTNTGNWQFVTNTAAAAPTVTDLGANVPVSATTLYELALFSAPNGSSVGYRLKNLSTGNSVSGSAPSNLPANTTFLAPQLWMTNNATAAAVVMDLGGWYLESDQ